MLNGLYPVLLFYTVPDKNGKFLPPLPIYLDEGETKLALESESESLDVASETLADVKDGKVDIVQKGVTQNVRIELKAREDDAVLGTILPVLKNIATDVIAANDYKVAYFHRDVLIFEAKLSSFEKAPEIGTNLIRLSIVLQVKPAAKKKEDTQKPLEYSNKEPGLIGTSGPTQGVSGGGSLAKKANQVALKPVVKNTVQNNPNIVPIAGGGEREIIISNPKIIQRSPAL